MSAIYVNRVTFKYSSLPVLDNFCANVNCGQIYALLGPSGGGKTTLLRLILGRIQLQLGSITVLGHNPGLVNHVISYMPQSNALCPQFTVEQTFNYFKHIYRISNKKFTERYTTLQKLLNLPENKCIVSELSGGQQRRVSLAIALVNNSKIVILDEPTVGIDLLIIQNIWKYLNVRCKEGLTILFVTHYIEEATNANRVGLMRNGKLLAEDNPLALIEKYNERSLENVFLNLCLLDNKNIETSVVSDYVTKESDIDSSQHIDNNVDSDKSLLIYNLWIILILIHRNILKYVHMNLFSLVCILLPATQVLIYCLVYSKKSIEMKAAIFNEETTPDYSQKLLSSLTSVERHIIKPVNYPSISSAIKAVENGLAIGAIWFQNNYSDSLDERLENSLDIDSVVIDESNLHLYLDNSNIMYGNAFILSLRESLWKFLSNLSQSKNLTNIELPIQIEKTKLSEDLILKDGYLSAYLIFYLYLAQLVLSSLVLTQERKDGLFERSLIAGVSHHLVLISHLITNFLLSVIQIVLMYLTAFVMFDNVNNGSNVLIFSLLLTEALNSISTGLLISSSFKEEYICLIIVGFIAVPQLFTSGMFWPLESLDKYLKFANYFTPLTIPVETLRYVILKGWSLTNSNVMFGFLANIIPTFIFIILALIIFRHKQ